jgi:Tol biopolymer transport system component
MYLLKADGSGKPRSLLKSGFQNDEPHVSPDGHWIAYGSVESGPWDIYVASFPDLQNRRQVSNGGGAQALWGADGRELYYLTLDGKMMAVEMRTQCSRNNLPRVTHAEQSCPSLHQDHAFALMPKSPASDTYTCW